MTLKNIAVLGPRGNVGSAIITELLKDGSRFNITAITRPTSTYTAPPNSNIPHKTVDYESLESLTNAFTGQDAIVNCVTGSATQYTPSKLIIDAAIAAGVKFFFANEFVGLVTSERFKLLPESAAGAKVRIREYLEAVGAEGKIQWTSLNGGPFFDMWLMKGPAGFDVKRKRARIYGTGENKVFWTPLPTIALAAANMIRKPELVVNRPIYICTVPDLNQNALLEALEKVLETKFSVEKVNVEKIDQHAKIALQRGEVAKAMKGLTISNQFYEENVIDFSHLVENELVGVQPVSVEEAVRQAVEIYGTECPIVEGMFNVEPCEI
ncbi:NAD(P)-binding protein [Lophiostoma macrostomum CBS 122681]|uniref:NAD(P)-binding protein n=1 Tax=Lophiostoma macrostomum CBS 122681 TaxID=1314788 RepID=A0A6A6SRI1_9PLEO|nr:NAD(P)-binding protein [Lophiostoma macrostomum CBS 122681]